MSKLEARAAIAPTCGGETWTSLVEADGQWTAQLPSGRRVRYIPATKDIITVEIDTDDAFAILGTEQGAGFDSDAAILLIRARVGASSDAEATRRALAVVAHYLTQ